jgi:hypothetical protein
VEFNTDIGSWGGITKTNATILWDNGYTKGRLCKGGIHQVRKPKT